MCMEDTGRMMMMTTMAACTTAGEMLASAAYAKVYIRALTYYITPIVRKTKAFSPLPKLGSGLVAIELSNLFC